MADKPPEYSISEFRKVVPKVFERVIRARDYAIRVTRRGTPQKALLINEGEYQRLEARIRELEGQLRDALRGRQAGASFRLIGSVELTVPEDELFEAGRAEQAARAAAKSREL